MVTVLTVVDIVMNKHLTSTITVVVVHTSTWPVDGKLLKVGIAVPVQLSVEIREDTTLQQRILGEVDASDNVSRLKLKRCPGISA